MVRAHLLSFAAVLVLAACGGGRPVYPLGDGGLGVVAGAVVKGPVAFATVTAYRLDASFIRGAPFGTTQADGQGLFTLNLPPYSGHILFVASTGVYTEEAVGSGVRIDGNELRAVLHDYRPGQAVGPVLITPVSHWAAALASFWVANGQAPLPQSMDDAYTHLNSHFGGLDWKTVQPTDFNSVDGGVGQDDADRAGLLLASLSQQALGMANRAAVTPGVGVTSLDLVEALADDLSADGFFDGVGKGGPIHLPVDQPVLPANAPASATLLDGQTVRGTLAAALMGYLKNPRDLSGLAFRDVQGTLNELSADTDSRLFRSGGTPYDVVPPLLAFSPVPPLYTADAGYSLGVLAADPGSGVARVYAQNGANTALVGVVVNGDAGVAADGGCIFGLTSVLPDAGCVSASLYQFQLSFPAAAHYPYTVYAVDNAGNSTQTNATSLAFTITFDNSPPQISTESTTQTYWNEQGMSLGSDGGVPVVPPRYVVATGESSVFATPSHDVYKVGTRLSWGSLDGGPTAGELNTQDPASMNVPFIPYDITYNAQVDSPIASVSYSVSCAGSPCGAFTTPATGSLIYDASTTSSARYLMPLTSDTVPGLAQITGAVSLAVSITATDAAGNSTTKPPDAVTFHVVGPPVLFAEDTTYASATDAHGTFAYRLGNGSYGAAFDAGTPAFQADGELRLVRYVLYNPAPQPVAVKYVVSQHQTGSITDTYSASEEWDEDVEVLSGYASKPDNWGGDDTSVQNWSYYACDTYHWLCAAGTVRETHTGGSTAYSPFCDATPVPVSHANAATVSSQDAVVPTYYANPHVGGGEGTAASRASTDPSYVIVPAANGTTPGALAVYLNRPVNAPRATPLVWGNMNPNTSGSHYQKYVQDFWPLASAQASTCSAQSLDDTPAFLLTGQRDLQNLTAASSVLNGAFTLWTAPVLTTNPVAGYGEPQSFNNVNFSRSISQ